MVGVLLTLFFIGAAIFIAGLVLLGLILFSAGLVLAMTVAGLAAAAVAMFLIWGPVVASGLLLPLLIGGVLLLALAIYVLVFRVHHLPLRLVGLRHAPAVPFLLWQVPVTIVRLVLRRMQLQQAQFALSTSHDIGGRTGSAYSFMYGAFGFPSKETLALETPEQFSMGWTTFANVYERCRGPLLTEWSAALRTRAEASRQFWPMVANYGLAFNLLVVERLTPARAQQLRADPDLNSVWTNAMDALLAAGNLYAIDMTFLATVETSIVNGAPRFTPATLTFLERDPAQATLTPFLVRVAGYNGVGERYFDQSSTTEAWLYALQAARTSITVWGIWLGHVYHWHIVTAAMVMTMFKTLPRNHIVRQLLGRQSDYLIGFDETLLLIWPFIAPPTSINNGRQLLKLFDAYAVGRKFFDDDPHPTLAALGLDQAAFTVNTPWDQYPVAGYLLTLWNDTGAYVGRVVDASYANDSDVAADELLQEWIDESSDPSEGNIQGLPPMNSLLNLKQVLTSLIFRITVHGVARMHQTANPSLSFMANFPPCLQDASIPAPASQFDTRRLLAYLPRTGTMGQMNQFLFVFAYSPPYKPFVPIAGIDAELSFEGPTAGTCNPALIDYRVKLVDFMRRYAQTFPGDAAQINQWPLNIET